MTKKPTYEELEQRTKVLEAENEKKNRFLRESRDGVYHLDLQNNEIEFYNDFYNFLFRGTDGKITKKSIALTLAGSISPEEINAIKREVAVSLQPGKEGGEVYFKLKFPDGTFHWLHDRWKIVRDDRGNPIAIEGIVRDITEIKQKGEVLRESEERFRLAFESSNDGVCLVDTEGHLLKVNKRMCEIFGYSKEELERMTVNDIAYPEDMDISPKFIQRSISGVIESTIFEKRYIHKQGHIVWGQVSSSLAKDLEGEPLYFISHVQDISERKRAEEQILIANERLQYLLSSTSAVIYTAKTSGDYGATFISDNVTQMVGYNPHEFIEDSGFWFDHIHPEDQSRISEEVSHVFEQELYNYEYRFQHKDSRHIWVRDEMKLVKDKDGNPIEIIGFWVDITDRKRAEEALRESEKYLSKAQEIAHIGHWKLNPETGEVFGSNELFRILNLNREDATLETFAGVVHPDDREYDLYYIRRGMEEGVPWDIEHRLLLKDGNEKTIHAIGEAIKDETGKIVELVGTVRDITERKESEQKLKESEQKIMLHMQQTMFGVIQWNLNFEVIEWNPAAEKIFGYRREEALGQHAASLIVPESVIPHVDNVWNQLLEQSGGTYSTNENVTKDGRILICEWFNTPLVNNKGIITGVASLVQDITDRKQAEEALQKERDTAQRYLDLAGVIFVAINKKSEVTLINLKGCKVLGYNEEEIVGKNWFENFIPEWLKKDLIPVSKKLLNGDIESAEYHENPILTKTAEERMIAWHNTILRDAEGNIIGHLSSGEDITERKKAEESLRESEERYRLVTETVNEGIILQEASGKVLTWNKEAEEIFGVSAEEVIGSISVDTDWPTIHEDGSKYHGADHPSMVTLQTGRPLRNELMGLYRPTGELRWISINTNPLFKENEAKPYAVAISFSDITERKILEDDLRKQKKHLENILDATTDGIWTWSFKTDQLEFSPKYYTMLGYEPNEFPASYDSWLELIHPDDVKIALGVAEKYLKNKPDVYENEFRLRAKTGDYRWIKAKARVVQRDDNGDAVLMIGNHEDITRNKQAEEALRESEKRLKSILDSIKTGIVIIDRETRIIVDANPSAIEMIGESKEKIIGSVCHQYICPAEFGKCPIIDLGQKIDNSERLLLKGNGGESPILKTASPIMINEKEHLLESFIDITERKRLEAQLQQAQKMEAIGTLAGGIAHDFNNILSPIMIHSEMAMADLPHDHHIQHNLKQIFKAGERARDLVKQILTFSRQREQERTPLKIGLIVKEIIKLVRASLPSTIEIHQNIEAESETVLADPTQIHQIFLNLCANAAHAMRDKGGVLEVIIADEHMDSEAVGQFPDLNPGSYLRLTVSDTGHGMDDEVINRIFEPYFTTKEPGEGTGMGLAVVHGIVKSYGGDIIVKSEVGKGTSFHVLFPKIETDISSAKERDVQLPKGTERILFVDDEKAAVDVIQTMLENLGYKVTARTSSVETLEVFKDKPDAFDLVITDMTMPNMTGVDLAKEIMKIKPDVPIILCTGFSEQIDENKAKEMGISAFVMKPIIMRDMATIIREVLDPALSKK